MNRQAFDILEFPALRALVRRNVQTDPARALIDRLEPFDDFDELSEALNQVAEMIELRNRGTRISFDGLVDSSDSISRLRIEGTALQPVSLLELARLCIGALEARAAILSEGEAAPSLTRMVVSLSSELQKSATNINRKILPGGELDDRASP